MAEKIDYDQGRGGIYEFLVPFVKGRLRASEGWYQNADACDQLVFWLSLFDVIIAYAHPDLLRDIARQINKQQENANKQLAMQLRAKANDYAKAASYCRIGFLPVDHPDLPQN